MKKAVYGSSWRTARAEYLKRFTFCAFCGKSAIVVDHIKPHRGDPYLFWDKQNWQPLCKLCHDGHKQRFEKTGRVIGCNLDGTPKDKNHHWSK